MLYFLKNNGKWKAVPEHSLEAAMHIKDNFPDRIRESIPEGEGEEE